MMACQAQGSLQRACEGRDGYSFIGLKTSTLSAFAPIDAAVLKFILLIVLRSPGRAAMRRPVRAANRQLRPFSKWPS
jgi:hypothetical protein